jgi:hypothetical protein
MSFDLFNVHLCQKVPFVLACFQENSDSDNKDALKMDHVTYELYALWYFDIKF